MRFIIFVTILLAAMWSGYWFFMSSKYYEKLYLWIDIESNDVSAKFSKIKGFPNRFDTTITDLEIKQKSLNPIKIDSLSSRNGGLIYIKNEVFRISQKQGFDNYGEEINFQLIKSLTTTPCLFNTIP